MREIEVVAVEDRLLFVQGNAMAIREERADFASKKRTCSCIERVKVEVEFGGQAGGNWERPMRTSPEPKEDAILARTKTA